MRRRDVLGLLGLPAAGLFDIAGVPAGRRQVPRVPDVELDLTAAPAESAILTGRPTRVWRYSASIRRGPASTVQSLPDSYLGPVLRFRRGQRVRVRFRNRLDEPSIVHWHGLDVPEAADGHPRLAVAGGRDYVYDFEVVNRAGTYWYHPHPHMRTAVQAYYGLAGVVVVADSEDDGLGLPAGPREIVCVVQDRRFDTSNQLVYAGAGTARAAAPGRGMGRGPGMRGRGMGGGMAGMEVMNGWLGDRVLVNGRPHHSLRVDRAPYRLRLLNGSNARLYKLALSDGGPFTILGSDGGLLEHPRAMAAVTLAPGQRVDALVDFSERPAGAAIRLRSMEFSASAVGHVGMMGETSPLPQGAPIDLLTFDVSGAAGARLHLPERLCTPPAEWRRAADAPVRRVPLTFMRMQWLIDGRSFAMDDVAAEETVPAGSTEVWEFHNQPNPMGMAMAHPMHVHGRQFRVVSRSGAGANPLRDGIVDTDATDTVLVLPGETVRVQLTFSTYPGRYLYHCHVLEHEDMGMMRNFRITPGAAG